jgi:hypothetical protein
MKNFIKIFIISVLLTSCGDFEPVIYEGKQTLAFFDEATSTLEVLIDETGSVDIQIGATTLSTTERTINVSVVEETTTTEASNYNVPTTVTIPANEYFATLTVSGMDTSLETATETITIQVDSVDGGVGSPSAHSISIYQICPVEAAFEGDYAITQLTAINPDDGIPMFEDQIVEITNAGGLTRSFLANYLGGLNIGQPDSEVVFTLICNEVIVGADIDTSLGCGDGAITLGPATTPSAFDPLDDTTFELTLTEYVTDGGCGANPYQTTFLFTKQ